MLQRAVWSDFLSGPQSKDVLLAHCSAKSGLPQFKFSLQTAQGKLEETNSIEMTTCADFTLPLDAQAKQ